MQPREGHRGADPQLAGQSRARAARRQLSLFGFFDRAPGPFVEIVARLRRRQAPGRANQQLDSQPPLELGYGLGHGGLPHVQSPRGVGNDPVSTTVKKVCIAVKRSIAMPCRNGGRHASSLRVST